MAENQLAKSCRYFDNLLFFHEELDKWNHSMNQELLSRNKTDHLKPFRISIQARITENMRKTTLRDLQIQERKTKGSNLHLYDELYGKTILKLSDSTKNNHQTSRAIKEKQKLKLKNMDLTNLGLTENTEVYKSMNRSLVIADEFDVEPSSLANKAGLTLNRCIDDNNKRLVTPITCMLMAGEKFPSI